MARPSTFSRALADRIAAQLASGKSLREICSARGMPNRSTVHSWIVNDVEGFAACYARAKEIGLDEIADQILEIADNASRDTLITEQGERTDHEWIARSKLRVDARKWLLTKLAPKKYGDRQAVEVSNPDGSLQMDETERATRVAQLLALAQARASKAGADPEADAPMAQGAQSSHVGAGV